MSWNLHIFVTFTEFATWKNVRRKVKTNFHNLEYAYKHYFMLSNVYLMQNIKKTHWNTSSSLFSHNTVSNLALQTIPNLLFLVDFQWNMLGDSININNLCCNPVVPKKSWWNLLQIVFLGLICTKKESLCATS